MADPAHQATPVGNGMAVVLPRRQGTSGQSERDVATAPGEVGVVSTSRLSESAIRLLDIVGAAVLLILLAIPLLIVAVIVRLDSKGPAIYRQRRLGRRMEPFSVAKFRTMHEGVGADKHREHVQEMIKESAGTRPMTKLEQDARVTRTGSFLRQTSIDELPQLWNVLRGEMSLVGPRPPIQYEVDRYPPLAFRRFAVRPGITGLWQVQGRSLLTFAEMIDLDREYVERRSLLLNLKILLLTLPTVIHGKGAA